MILLGRISLLLLVICGQVRLNIKKEQTAIMFEYYLSKCVLSQRTKRVYNRVDCGVGSLKKIVNRRLI